MYGPIREHLSLFVILLAVALQTCKPLLGPVLVPITSDHDPPGLLDVVHDIVRPRHNAEIDAQLLRSFYPAEARAQLPYLDIVRPPVIAVEIPFSCNTLA